PFGSPSPPARRDTAAPSESPKRPLSNCVPPSTSGVHCRHPSTIPRAILPSSRSLFRITRPLLLFLLGRRRTAEGPSGYIFSPSPRVPDGAARPVIAPRHFVFAVDRPDGNSD
ncbi:unnamed protein product, partial [Ixodes persulcatus]